MSRDLLGDFPFGLDVDPLGEGRETFSSLLLWLLTRPDAKPPKIAETQGFPRFGHLSPLLRDKGGTDGGT